MQVRVRLAEAELAVVRRLGAVHAHVGAADGLCHAMRVRAPLEAHRDDLAPLVRKAREKVLLPLREPVVADAAQHDDELVPAPATALILLVNSPPAPYAMPSCSKISSVHVTETNRAHGPSRQDVRYYWTSYERKDPRMEKQQLGQFAAMAECKSMQEVEEKLGLPRAESSKILMGLEAELGVPLMNHDHDGLELTSYGKILVDASTHIIVDFSRLEDSIKKEMARQETTIRAGVFAATHCFVMMPQIAIQFPEKNFVVSLCVSREVVNDLKKGRIDFAIIPHWAVKGEPLEFLGVEVEQAYLSVPFNSKLVTKDKITLDDLASEPLYLVNDIYGVTQWYEDIYAECGGDMSRVQRPDSDEYLIHMDETPRSNFSSSVMQMFTSAGADRQEIPIDADVARREIGIAYRKDHEAKLRPILDYVETNKDVLYGEHAFLPHLLNPCRINNLDVVKNEI